MKRLPFGVTEDAVERFVASDRLVSEFVGKYEGRARSRHEHARDLCLFFNWLKQNEQVKLSPSEFLNLHLQKSKSLDVAERRWACSLVLKFTRDNPLWRDKSDGYKRGMFLMVKQFFDYCAVPLSLGNGHFGKCKRRKYNPKQMTVEKACQVLGVLPQRERAVCMVQLQSGQSIDAVLNRLSYSYLENSIRSGQKRIRLDFSERKGNGFNYFSFISVDSIQELQKWFRQRGEWLCKTGVKTDFPFITRTGEAYSTMKFDVQFNRVMRSHKLGDGPFSITSHMFRKLFKTLSSPPERNVSPDYVEFMMGHLSGIESVGGIYDRTPEINEHVVEREYAKLESYLNIFSNKSASRTDSIDKEIVDLLSDPKLLPSFKEWLKSFKSQD